MKDATMTSPKTMTSRFDSTCCRCGGTIRRGETIRYQRGTGAWHPDCQAQKPALAPGVDALLERISALHDQALRLEWDLSQLLADAVNATGAELEAVPATTKPAAAPKKRKATKKKKAQPVTQGPPRVNGRLAPDTQPRGQRVGNRVPNPFFQEPTAEQGVHGGATEICVPKDVDVDAKVAAAPRSARFAGIELD